MSLCPPTERTKPKVKSRSNKVKFNFDASKNRKITEMFCKVKCASIPSLSAPGQNTTSCKSEHSTQHSPGSTGSMARHSTVPAQVGCECPLILQKVLTSPNLIDIQSESRDMCRAGQINLDRLRYTPVSVLSTQTDNFDNTALAVAHCMITNLNNYFSQDQLV